MIVQFRTIILIQFLFPAHIKRLFIQAYFFFLGFISYKMFTYAQIDTRTQVKVELDLIPLQ